MELYLYHYFEASRGPFKNLSSLRVEDADEVMRQLKTTDVFASQRSEDYMNVRRGLEERARKLFIDKGGKPRSDFPHYFTLGPCEWIKSWYSHGQEIRVHWDDVDDEVVSFTYGDLFPTMRFLDGKPYREQVYTKKDILVIIEQYGFPQDWNRDGSKGPERYIEVQIWDNQIWLTKENTHHD